MKKKTLLLVLPAIAMGLAGCVVNPEGGKYNPPEQGEKEDDRVKVTSLTAVKDSITIEVEDTKDLVKNVKVNPTNATDKSLTFSVTDDSVLEINEAGVATALKVGRVTVTAASVSDPDVKCTFVVVCQKEGEDVPDKVVTEVTSVKSHPTEVEVGGSILKTSVELNVKYDDNSTGVVNPTSIEFDNSTVANDVVVTCKYNNFDPVTFTINVVDEVVIEAISPQEAMAMMDEAGEGKIVAGLQRVKGICASGTQYDAQYKEYSGGFEGVDNFKLQFKDPNNILDGGSPDGMEIIIEGYLEKYNGKYQLAYLKADISPTGQKFTPNLISAKAAEHEGTLESITVGEAHRQMIKDGEFVKETVTAHYSDGATANVTTSAQFTGYDLSTLGEQTVTVSYTEDGVTKTATYQIEVIESIGYGTVDAPLTVTQALTVMTIDCGTIDKQLTKEKMYCEGQITEVIEKDFKYDSGPCSELTLSDGVNSIHVFRVHMTAEENAQIAVGKTLKLYGFGKYQNSEYRFADGSGTENQCKVVSIGGESKVAASISDAVGPETVALNGTIDPSTVTITVHYTDGSSLTGVHPERVACETGTAGATTATAYYGDFNTTFNITVLEEEEANQFDDAYAAALPLGKDEVTGEFTIFGIVVGLQGNSFFLQYGDKAIEVYNYQVDSAQAIVGKEVKVVATFQNYYGTIETKSVKSAEYTGNEGTVSPIAVADKAALDAVGVNMPIAPAQLTVVSNDSQFRAPAGTDKGSDGKLQVKIGSDSTAVTLIINKNSTNTAAATLMAGLAADDKITVDKAICAIYSSKKQITISDDSVVTKEGEVPPVQKTLESISIEGSLTKITYTEGEKYSTAGLSVLGHYDDESTDTIAATITIDKEIATLGDTKITVSTTFEGKDVSKDFDVTVNPKGDTPVGDQTATVVTSELGYENGTEVSSIAITNDLSVAFSKGENSNPPKYYTSGTAIRCYAKNTITFTNAAGTIKSITLTLNDGDDLGITASTGSVEGYVWTGEAESVTFTVGGDKGNIRIAGITIVYEGGEAPTPVEKSIESVSLSETSKTLVVDGTFTLKETVVAKGGADTTVTWESSDSTKVKVENGVVTALAVTTEPITITCKSTFDTTKSATCSVTVNEKQEQQDGATSIALSKEDGGSNNADISVIVDGTTYAGLKAGSSKASGSFVIKVPAEAKKLHFYAAAWKGSTETGVTIAGLASSQTITTVGDDAVTGNGPYSFTGDVSKFLFELDLGTLSSAVNLEFSADARFIVWNVTYTK